MVTRNSVTELSTASPVAALYIKTKIVTRVCGVPRVYKRDGGDSDVPSVAQQPAAAVASVDRDSRCTSRTAPSARPVAITLRPGGRIATRCACAPALAERRRRRTISGVLEPIVFCAGREAAQTP